MIPPRATLAERYRFFRENLGCHVVGESAVCAWNLARAEQRAADLSLEWGYEDEQEPWDGDCPAPEYDFCVFVHEGRPDGRPAWRTPLASVGHVGVDSLDDTYLRVVAAELFDEVLSRPEFQHGAPGARCGGDMQAPWHRARWLSVNEHTGDEATEAGPHVAAAFAALEIA